MNSLIETYGGGRLTNHFATARSLIFLHPTSGQSMVFEAPLPVDMETLVASLRA